MEHMLEGTRVEARHLYEAVPGIWVRGGLGRWWQWRWWKGGLLDMFGWKVELGDLLVDGGGKGNWLECSCESLCP